MRPLLKNLHETLFNQKRYWPNTYTVLMIGEPGGGTNYHQNYSRVIPADQLDQLIQNGISERQQVENTWSSLPGLHKIFSSFSWSQENKNQVVDIRNNADLLTTTLWNLTKL